MLMQDPSERCVKHVIAVNRKFGDAVLLEMLKKCQLKASKVVARIQYLDPACIAATPSVILAAAGRTSQLPFPSCLTVRTFPAPA